MKWFALKTFLKKAAIWTKNNWYVPILVLLLLAAVLVYAITKNGIYVGALMDLLEKGRENHRKEVEKLNEIHAKEASEKKRISREYEKNLSLIEKEYSKKNEELGSKKKKELKKLVEAGYNDPETLSREIARLYGLEHG
jgi:ribosome-binding ATPase YchF (GTP1/OBG family)